ncbi:hypothetical protein L1887_30846 [Cichorium endivia]|nr:hypothetical protein L1887_30846 [Cichorium endivia]
MLLCIGALELEILDQPRGLLDRVLPLGVKLLTRIASRELHLGTYPWSETPYKNSIERTAFGHIRLSGFLSQDTLRVTRRRALDVQNQRSHRLVFQCYVFGPKNAGKLFQNSYALNRDCFYTVNAVVDQVKGTKKTLILHEIQEDDVEEFLSSKESLASCDITLFVYDG